MVAPLVLEVDASVRLHAQNINKSAPEPLQIRQGDSPLDCVIGTHLPLSHNKRKKVKEARELSWGRGGAELTCTAQNGPCSRNSS